MFILIALHGGQTHQSYMLFKATLGLVDQLPGRRVYLPPTVDYVPERVKVRQGGKHEKQHQLLLCEH